MSTIEQHIKDSILLTNSLTIKLTELGLAINKGLLLQYGIPSSSNQRTWKYYLNLAGAPHSTNKPIKITLLETNQIVTLTKDVLRRNKYTREMLRTNSKMYSSLVSQYPDEEAYIKGCIYPVDIDRAIEAKNGTILGWNEKLVEESETNLINELQTYVYDFLNRWHIPEYSVTDELYLPSLLSLLYSSIPAKIIAIRADKVYTNEVHSFHMSNFFDSRLGTYNDVSGFNKTTQYWLYKNFRSLVKNTGKDITLNQIAKKVLEPNGIGVARYLVTRPDPTPRQVEEYKFGLPSYENKDPLFSIEPLNDKYELTSTARIETEEVLKSELKTLTINRTTAEEDHIVNEAKRTLNQIHVNNSTTQFTKILDVKVNKFFSLTGSNMFKFIMDHWAFALHNEEIEMLEMFKDPNGESDSEKGNLSGASSGNVQDFVDPSTSKVYTINAKQAFLMLIRLMVHITGQNDDKLRSYWYNSVLDPDGTKLEKLFEHMYKDGFTDKLIPEMVENYPTVHTKIFNKDTFSSYLKEILNYHSYIWHLDANSESFATSATIKHMYAAMLKETEWYIVPPENRLDGMTAEELLKKENVDFVIPDVYDGYLSLNELIKTFTGYNVSSIFTKSDLVSNIKQFINKMTSYTTQILADTEEVESIQVYYNNHSILRTKKPIIGNVIADVHPLEHADTRVSSTGANVVDAPLVIIENRGGIKGSYLKRPMVEGYGIITDKLDEAPYLTTLDSIPNKPDVQIQDRFKYSPNKYIALLTTEEIDFEIPAPEVKVG